MKRLPLPTVELRKLFEDHHGNLFQSNSGRSAVLSFSNGHSQFWVLNDDNEIVDIWNATSSHNEQLIIWSSETTNKFYKYRVGYALGFYPTGERHPAYLITDSLVAEGHALPLEPWGREEKVPFPSRAAPAARSLGAGGGSGARCISTSAMARRRYRSPGPSSSTSWPGLHNDPGDASHRRAQSRHDRSGGRAGACVETSGRAGCAAAAPGAARQPGVGGGPTAGSRCWQPSKYWEYSASARPAHPPAKRPGGWPGGGYGRGAGPTAVAAAATAPHPGTASRTARGSIPSGGRCRATGPLDDCCFAGAAPASRDSGAGGPERGFPVRSGSPASALSAPAARPSAGRRHDARGRGGGTRHRGRGPGALHRTAEADRRTPRGRRQTPRGVEQGKEKGR